MTLVQKISHFCRRERLFEQGDTILLAVSGGPDSVCLLHVFDALRREKGIRIAAAHLNHGLRPGAVTDQKFVEGLCRKLHVPFFTETQHVRAPHRSLEEAAREARLDFLIRTAKKIKADALALAHTEDDLAETVLMRILRGTGLSGMRAIMPKRTINGTLVIRPLLSTDRKEVQKFLVSRHLKFRVDPTNASLKFLRNKIRLTLIPALRTYNPKIQQALAHLAETVTHDYDRLAQEGEHLFQKTARRSSGSIRLNLHRLTTIHPALRRMLYRRAITCLKGDTRRMTLAHIREIDDLFLQRPPGATIRLPANVTVTKKPSFLFFHRHIAN